MCGRTLNLCPWGVPMPLIPAGKCTLSTILSASRPSLGQIEITVSCPGGETQQGLQEASLSNKVLIHGLNVMQQVRLEPSCLLLIPHAVLLTYR